MVSPAQVAGNCGAAASLPPTLAECLLAHADVRSSHPAILTEAGGPTFGTFVRQICATAASLRSLGVERGDRVLLCAPNSPEVAVAYFAIHWVGAVAVPLDPSLPPAALRDIFAHCEPRLALVGDGVDTLPAAEP